MREESAHGALMDQVYRRQRHIYNFTRRYYLIGRDDLIRDLDLRPRDRAVEIGCGTARNLIAIARAYPETHLFGLDASGAMLATAAGAVDRAGLSRRIVLKKAMADEISPQLFGETRGFDAAIFSYSLSMIPDWRGAILAARGALSDRGRMHIVDFGDLASLPFPLSTALRFWLRRFHVAPRAELLGDIERAAATQGGSLRIYPGRYSFRWSGREVPGGVLANVAGRPQAGDIP